MSDLAMILVSALVTFVGLLVGSMIVAAGHSKRKSFDGRKRVNMRWPEDNLSHLKHLPVSRQNCAGWGEPECRGQCRDYEQCAATFDEPKGAA